MFRMHSASFVVAVVILIFGFSAPPLNAQQSTESGAQQVLSANPFGLLLEFFNIEYERIISETTTFGIGGSFVSDDERYINADVFWRFYPGANALNGWAFGVKAGITEVSDHDTYFGYGFDVNRSWVLGPNNNFYVGVGFGLKRLYGASDQDFSLDFVPTIRIVNVGIAF